MTGRGAGALRGVAEGQQHAVHRRYAQPLLRSRPQPQLALVPLQ